MIEIFDAERNLFAKVDEAGDIREVSHRQAPVIQADAEDPFDAARRYLEEYGDFLGIDPAELSKMGEKANELPGDDDVGYRYLIETGSDGVTTVGFIQTCFDVPVWGAGLSVYVKHNPFRVVAASITAHERFSAQLPNSWNREKLEDLQPEDVAAILAQGGAERFDAKNIEVAGYEYGIYRYLEAQRLPIYPIDAQGMLSIDQVPPISAEIQEGQHYLATKVHFWINTETLGPIPWVAMIEVQTESLLHLRPMVGGLTGKVFHIDPVSQTGDPTHFSGASNATVKPDRTDRTLHGVGAPGGGLLALVGGVIELNNPNVPDHLDFEVRTDNFAALNAYYHCERFFREVATLDSDDGTYFAPHNFPLEIRLASTDTLTVFKSGGGIERVIFSPADTSPEGSVNAACTWRIVLHELGGHGTLCEWIQNPNLGFAHSAGDSIAAILSDPDSLAPDPGLTFPWINLDEPRRHDRPVSDGWAWGGNKENPGPLIDFPRYQAEQILSTTLFRAYRSLGGAAAYPANRRLAARWMVHIILRAIRAMTSAVAASTVENFLAVLEVADGADWITEGHAGDAYFKVLRWAFERQGYFQAQPNPVNVTTPGRAPEVDVYIEDGRQGQYEYQAVHWACEHIWNRRIADGGLIHQQPIVNQVNHAYVRIKNRGFSTATNVVVRGYHCRPSTGLIWPIDWQPMQTAQLGASNVPPNNSAEVVVGPFHWIPSQLDHECMLMIVTATGDITNADLYSAARTIPEWRLVPHDNNIGQRNVSPVAASGLGPLLETFNPRRFKVRNPFALPADMEIVAELPDVLTNLGWQLDAISPLGGKFSLEAKSSLEVEVTLAPGEDFSADHIRESKDRTLHLFALANGILVGGMSYTLDPDLEVVPDL